MFVDSGNKDLPDAAFRRSRRSRSSWRTLTAALPLLLCGMICCSKKSSPPPAPPVPPPPGDTSKPVLHSDVAFWLTKGDQTVLLQRQNVSLVFGTGSNSNPTITVDTTRTYQSIDGFGYTMTDGSADLINHLPSSDRAAILRELFATDSNSIGVSYLRVSIGASDLSASVFSYDDNGTPSLPDTNLQYFSLANSEFDLVPVLKQVLAINPAIRILGSPWSAPLWMKTNNNSVGGTLQPKYFDVYARYLVKYVQAMKAEGITIDAITPQNEPMNPNNNPSMLLSAGDEAAFIKNNLGPALVAAGLTTKIIDFDHNCDNPGYPLAVLSDPGALPYVDGSAFHLYGGDISALSQIHSAYPSKNVYFTEQWVGGPSNFPADLDWAVRNLVIGAPRNWSRNVLEWNLANDPNYQPHTVGGCTNCLGALTIGTTISRNVSYYIIGHASKFVRPGSVRVDSNIFGNLPNVAFLTPDGKKVLIVLNDTGGSLAFNIHFNGRMVTTALDGGAVGTYMW
ncbi:MAG: glycoside hydrolase family 30 beta sandwich domain-containing protein [Bacteroidota bacterium]|nr:glycoside hydrolase family 30 beta sandwich domain-containing protein [Bacteroidota bacterium]